MGSSTNLIDGLQGRSPAITINADTAEATAAKLRVGYTRSVGVDTFLISINGNVMFAPAGIRGIDDEEFGLIDTGLVSREFDVPLEFLNDGANTVQFTFTGGGFLSSTALVVTTADSGPSLGDVNLDGVVNFLDIPAFISRLQSGVFQAEADLNSDGVVDFSDIPPFIGVLSSQ